MQSRVSAAAQCDILMDPGSSHLSALHPLLFVFTSPLCCLMVTRQLPRPQEGNQKSKRKSVDGAIIYSFVQWRRELGGGGRGGGSFLSCALKSHDHLCCKGGQEEAYLPETTNLHLRPKLKTGSSVSKDRELWLC